MYIVREQRGSKVKNLKKIKIPVIIFLILQVYLPFSNVNAQSALERDVDIYTPFPNITVTAGQNIALDIEIINNGNNIELLDITTQGPDNWEITLTNGEYVVRSLYIKNNESTDLIFTTTPFSDTDAGNYSFIISVISNDKQLNASLMINVELTETVSTSGIILSTPYPSVEGPSNELFEFRLGVKNMGNKATIIDFDPYYPQGWSVFFKPRYEERLIRSLDFTAGQTQTIMVSITPPPDVLPDEYNITVVASTGGVREQLSFSILIIGLHEMAFSPTEGLLSFDAVQGKESVVTLVFNNTGTAPLEDVVFFSDKPLGWDVLMEPDEISLIEPDGVREIRCAIKPPKDAIPGDYAVSLYSAVAKLQLSKQIDYRVTVKGSVSWGYVGLGIIVILIFAIVVIFMRLGRR